jgi:cell fate regulator YaaT (PSP1 superfamily)
MPEVVGVSFRRAGKIYHFHPGSLPVRQGDYVLAETKRGLEVGRVILGRHSIEPSALDGPLRRVRRIVDSEEVAAQGDRTKEEEEALRICAEKVAEHKLPMRLVGAEYTFDGQHLVFYFTSLSRVDFRQLLRELYGIFNKRIQLLQIGVRDEAKMLGGLGPCGRSLCCATFLREFDAVAIRMAKAQGLSLNPTKISGVCGRLMCCLKYEYEHYADTRSRLPRVGSMVEHARGAGKVVDVNCLKHTVLVQGEDDVVVEVPGTEVRTRGSAARAPEPQEPEPAEKTAEPSREAKRAEAAPTQQERPSRSRRRSRRGGRGRGRRRASGAPKEAGPQPSPRPASEIPPPPSGRPRR